MNKICSKCGEIRDSLEFYAGRSDCKECKIASSRARYLPIKEKVRHKRQSVYHGNHKCCRECKRWLSLDNYSDKPDNWDNLNHACKKCEKQRGREYYVANLEECLASNRERYRNNPEEKQKANREWQRNNRIPPYDAYY